MSSRRRPVGRSARPPDTPAVFLSYRRNDAVDFVHRIRDAYGRLYSPSSIFLDTQDIQPGAPFPDVLRDRVRGASVVLVIIGPSWSLERLQIADDWVREEIRLALEGGQRVIPVLVNGGRLPDAKDLPRPLRPLVTKNHFNLSSENFASDIRELLDKIAPDVGGASELNAWQEHSLFTTGLGARIFQRLQASLKPPEFMAVYGDRAGWYDVGVNAALLDLSLKGGALPSRLLPEPWLAHGASADEARKRYAIQRKTAAGVSISNDRKIRLASDLTAPFAEPVQLQETDYVSSLMTDQMAFVRVARDKAMLYHETDGFLESGQDRTHLLPLSHTRMSNQLGASTLAFTTDGYLVFVQQTATNSQSAGALAPSGSGSLDWEDLEEAGSDDLLAIVRQGAARELIEECGLQHRLRPTDLAKHSIHVYAFARMVHRGGKPEFFCVARLPFTSEEVHAAKPTRHESRFTQHSESASADGIDFGKDIRTEVIRVCSHFSNGGFDRIEPQTLKLSYPLHHALDLLSEALATPSPRVQSLAGFIADGFGT